MPRHAAVCALAVSILLAPLAHAQPGPGPAAAERPAPALGIGDPAPVLAVEAFLQGEPIAAFEPGSVYVVEFWATWCAPCVEVMPHLSDLAAHYRERGLRVVGVDIRELRRSGPGYEDAFDAEGRANVEAFVRSQGPRLTYTVAYDGAAKRMDTTWMQAAGLGGVPATFVVDRAGTLAWIGHPMVLRLPLDAILAGTWDPDTGPQQVAEAEAAYLGALELLRRDPDAGLLAWDAAATSWPLLAEDLVGRKVDALLAAGRGADAAAAGQVLLAEALRRSDARALNRLAWGLVDPQAALSQPDLELALAAAEAARTLTEGRDAGVLDTLARVHASRGAFDTAVAVQARAVQCADEALKPGLAETLAEYERDQAASADADADGG